MRLSGIPCRVGYQRRVPSHQCQSYSASRDRARRSSAPANYNTVQSNIKRTTQCNVYNTVQYIQQCDTQHSAIYTTQCDTQQSAIYTTQCNIQSTATFKTMQHTIHDGHHHYHHRHQVGCYVHQGRSSALRPLATLLRGLDRATLGDGSNAVSLHGVH